MFDPIETIERHQNMISTQLELIERYRTPGNHDSMYVKKLETQLGQLIDGLGRVTAAYTPAENTPSKK